MITVPSEHGMQADVVFVIESTATNGAYINDFKQSYLVPTLEYFSQGSIEEREYASETSLTLYGLVVYHAADCLPAPFTGAYGPFSNPNKLLHTLDKITTEMVGGKGESHANIGEGLATALQCFEDLQVRREPNVASQKHCILVCNSPPYQVGVQESYAFSGYSVEQLANLFQERNISLSILSPRKISALFKLYEMAGGDLPATQTKNYTKDPRHLVLLRNYNLKENPVGPPTGAAAAVGAQSQAASVAQIALSPLQSNDSPNPNQTPQNIVTQAQQQQQGPPPPAFRNPQSTPQNINTVQQQQQQQAVSQQQQQQQQQSMSAPMGGRPQFNPQISAPPNYHPGAMGGPRGPHPRAWMRQPFMGPGQTGPAGQSPATPQPPTSTQSSALIAQLSQPPQPPSAMGLNVQPFAGAQNSAMGANTQAQAQQQQQMNQQLNQQQQQQLRMNMQVQQQQQLQQQNAIQQQNAQQVQMGMQAQSTPIQGGPQLNVPGVNQPMASQGPQTVAAAQAASVQGAPVPAQMAQGQQGNGAPGAGNQPMMNAERTVIWKGMLEWVEKSKSTNDAPKRTWQVPCQVAATTKDGEPEVKAESWPSKLIMQLMPKMLIGNIGQAYLKNSKSVVFYPSACDALESLTKVMSNGFAGCVHFTSTPTCNIKVLLLLYTAEKRTFIGFIPNDQQAFVDRLRKVIQQQKTSHAMIRQSPVPLMPTGPGTSPGAAGTSVMPGQVPNSGISQSGILMSQTNTMTMGGGQITQNVMPNNGLPQQSLASSTMQQNQLNIQAVGLAGGGGGLQGQMNSGGGNMVQQQQMEMARQQNLMKIHQLQQTLEAAQQQEAQYKSQMEVVGSIQQNLEHAQAQEMQYKQLEQAQQAQRAMNAGQGMQTPQQPNAQRMMRPVMQNAMGLRHLLQQQQQQQQPQYRQVLGMQQQVVGPRTQMAPRQMAPVNSQNQQFDEVSNYDFLG